MEIPEMPLTDKAKKDKLLKNKVRGKKYFDKTKLNQRRMAWQNG